MLLHNFYIWLHVIVLKQHCLSVFLKEVLQNIVSKIIIPLTTFCKQRIFLAFKN